MNRPYADGIAISSVSILVAAGLTMLAGCGGQQSGAPTMQSPVQSSISPQRVTVSPASVQVVAGSSYQFSETVTPATAMSAVNWSVAGSGCSGVACGSVDSTGRYTAPVSLPSALTVTITAASTADQTIEGMAQVYLVSSQEPTPGGFAYVKSMTTPRQNPSATLLPDGRVLIVGGQQSGPTAELYDPGSRMFQASSANITGTPVLLHNGQLLIAGGGTAEIYDPKTDSVTVTGQMVVANQAVYDGTVLANGKALVLGSNDAELYDPASGKFASVGSYAANGIDTKARRLADGRVLILGSNTPQLFDPSTSTFSNTGSLSDTQLVGMDLSTATVLKNGEVLLAGGMSDWRTNAAVLYDPSTGKFSAAGSMNDIRDAHAALLLLDGRVLVVGGDSSSCSGTGVGSYCYFTGSLSTAELYDSGTETFSRAGNMKEARTSPAVALLQNGDVLIVGGVRYCGINCFVGATSSAEIYHPQ